MVDTSIVFFFRARPVGVQWRPLWDSMAQECKEELTLVEADTLLDTLEAYLQKHRYLTKLLTVVGQLKVAMISGSVLSAV